MMQTAEIVKQAIEFQKQSLDGWRNTMDLVEKQATTTIDWMINQATWVPSEGRDAIQKWTTAYQKERLRLRTFVDKGISIVEDAFVETSKAPAKTKSKETGSAKQGDAS